MENPELFFSLQGELGRATERLVRASREKQRFLAGLSPLKVTLDDRHRLFALMKIEQAANADCQKIQRGILELLRTIKA